MEQPDTPDPRRGRLWPAWAAVALSVASYAFAFERVVGCATDAAFFAWLAGVGFAAVAVPITLVQQLRAAAGSRRWAQAIVLYVLAGVLTVGSVLVLIMLTFGSDSC